MSSTLTSTDDYGVAINFSSWVLLIISGLAVGLKLIGKVMVTKSINADDALLTLAIVACGLETMCINLAVSHGYGRRQEAIASEDLASIQQYLYASMLLYVAALGIAKIGLLEYIRTLCKKPYTRVAAFTIAGCCAAWTIIGLLAAAFQCAIPHPWTVFETQRCFRQPAFWDALAALEILLDLALVLLPTYILYDLQMAWTKKGWLIAAFAGRIFAFAPLIARLYFLQHAYTASDKTHLAAFALTVATQTHLNFSLAIMAPPFLKKFYDRTQHGAFGLKLNTGLGQEQYSQMMADLKTGATKTQPKSRGSTAGRVGSLLANLRRGSAASGSRPRLQPSPEVPVPLLEPGSRGQV